MTPFDPKDLRALLPLYVGGDLDPEEAELVRRQLPSHPELVAELAAFEDAREALLASRPTEPTGIDLWPGIRSSLASEGLLGDAAHRASTAPNRTAPSAAEPLSHPAATPEVAPALPSRRVAHGLRLLVGSGLAAAALIVFLSTQDGSEPGGIPGAAGAGWESTAERVAEPAVAGPDRLAMETPLERGTEELGATLAAATPTEAQDAAGGLRPVLVGDPSMEDIEAERARPTTWIASPPRASLNNLAGYR